MVSIRQKQKKALSQRKKNKKTTSSTRHDFFDLVQRRETNDRVSIAVFESGPNTPKQQRDLAHFQWIQANKFMKRTDVRRQILEKFNGCWIRIMGVVSDAKIVSGVMRICVSSPEALYENDKGEIDAQQIDSHIWIKMSNFKLNEHEDNLVDKRPKTESTSLNSGYLSLGDFFSFDGFVEPYVIRGKVKYGVSKIKNLSTGVIIWKSKKHNVGNLNIMNDYSRNGWLIKAEGIDGTKKFRYQFASWEEIKQQKEYFEKYQSDYYIIEKTGQ